MKVLITGGSGFIGSHLADRLLGRGDEVLVIDNYATGRRDNLAPHPKLTVVEGTIADRELVDRVFGEFGPEVVVHAAASYKDPDDWAEDSRTNVLGTANVVQATKQAGARRIIYFQTALCYGLAPAQQPTPVGAEVRPEGSSYAISKTAGEQYVTLGELDSISFRLANAYGPRNLSGPLPTFYSRLTTNKPCFVMDTRRDFVYVDDVVGLALLAIDGRGRKGIYNVSSGRDHAIAALFDAAVKALGLTPAAPVEVRERGPDDAFTILLDPGATHAEFGWATTTALADGVARTIASYRAHGVGATYTHLRDVIPS